MQAQNKISHKGQYSFTSPYPLLRGEGEKGYKVTTAIKTKRRWLMKDFLSGIISYFFLFILVPGFSFCFLSLFAVSPVFTTGLFFIIGACFTVAFVIVASDSAIRGNTEEARLEETREYHQAMFDFSRPEYVPGVVQKSIYTSGNKFELEIGGKQFIAYIHNDGSVLLKNLKSGKSKSISIIELRKLRAQERTYQGRKNLSWD